MDGTPADLLACCRLRHVGTFLFGRDGAMTYLFIAAGAFCVGVIVKVLADNALCKHWTTSEAARQAQRDVTKVLREANK